MEINSVRSKSLAFIVFYSSKSETTYFQCNSLSSLNLKCGSNCLCKNHRSIIESVSILSPKMNFILYSYQPALYCNRLIRESLRLFYSHMKIHIYLSTAPNTHNELNLSNIQTIECQQIYLLHSEGKEQKAK